MSIKYFRAVALIGLVGLVTYVEANIWLYRTPTPKIVDPNELVLEGLHLAERSFNQEERDEFDQLEKFMFKTELTNLRIILDSELYGDKLAELISEYMRATYRVPILFNGRDESNKEEEYRILCKQTISRLRNLYDGLVGNLGDMLHMHKKGYDWDRLSISHQHLIVSANLIRHIQMADENKLVETVTKKLVNRY